MNARGSSHEGEIARSWARSAAAGLQPDQSLAALGVEDFDSGSRLLDAASPVLTRMANELEGTGYSVILADRDARLVDLRFGDGGLESLLADDGAIRGRRFTEHSSGTNSLATVHETRAPLKVVGNEHYIEAMRKFACYGMPVIHPLTNRLEGVLDITCLTSADNALLGPLIRHAVSDIQDRLLERSNERERRLFIAFQDAVRRRQHDPIVAVGEGITLTNRWAADLIEPVDQAILRAAALASPRSPLPKLIVLASEVQARLDWTQVEPRLFVVRLLLENQPGAEIARSVSLAGIPQEQVPPPRSSFLVRGESGTGRTTAVLRADPDAVIIDGVRLFDQSPTEWLRELSAALGNRDHLIAIEHIEMLPPLIARRVREKLTDSGAWFALTETVTPEPGHAEQGHLARLTHASEELVPLRAMPQNIPAVAAQMLAELAPEKHLTSGAAAMLTGRRWPGNMRELHVVLARAASRTAGPAIMAADFGLPPERTGDSLSALEQSEKDVILAVMSKANGNKTGAARALGISRTTLYKKMRSFNIPG